MQMFLKNMGYPIYKRGSFQFLIVGWSQYGFVFKNNAKVVLELVNFKKCQD